jgi:hypothetical protein
MKFINKKDLIVLIILGGIISSFFIFSYVFSDKNVTGANVFIDGVLYMQIGSEGRYEIFDNENEYLQTVIFNNGRIKVIESECKNKVCEHTGWISNSNQKIICLPFKIVVEPIGGKDDSGVDLYTW